MTEVTDSGRRAVVTMAKHQEEVWKELCVAAGFRDWWVTSRKVTDGWMFFKVSTCAVVARGGNDSCF